MNDSRFDGEFDTDDELRALIRGGDPAGTLSPADPAALASLLEVVMSTDLDLRPEVTEDSRATGTRGPRRLTWLVAAAAVAAIAAGGTFALNGPSTDHQRQPQAGPKPSTTVADPGAPLAGQVTTLGVATQQGRCAPASPEILSQYTVAFQGTVTAIEGDTVTLAPSEVLSGDVGETVQVTAPEGLDALLGTVGFQVGQDYLVAAYDGQVSQCYSGSAGGELRPSFDKAFVR